MLDNLSQIKNLDKKNMLGSIESLADQCRQAWQDLKGVNLPKNYRQIKNIVAVGMGASALGAHIIKSLYGPEMKKTFEIVNDYHLPAYVNKDSLVVLVSYSGSTEEVLSCLAEARKKQTKLLIITSGKELAMAMKKNKIPGYCFAPRFNPCGAPRMGLGYSLFGLLILLGRIQLIKFSENEADKTIKLMEKYSHLFGAASPLANNLAKQLAQTVFQRIPICLASHALAGSLHTAVNQINENAKTFAAWFVLPEINHHLMEGLIFPKKQIKNDLIMVFFESTLDEMKNQSRLSLTKAVAKKMGLETTNYLLQEKSRLGQIFEMLVLGSYASFYLAMLYGIDPTPNPTVDWFKRNLR